MKVNAATLDYIRAHVHDDVRQLAFRPVPAGVDLRTALIQIEGRQLAAHKLPTWAATDGLLFPPRLALEQCSSEVTAAYKRRVVESLHHHDSISNDSFSTFLDLTGGLGIDFTAIAPLFERAIYVEQQEQLCNLARHNFPLLGLADAEVRCAEAEETLDSFSAPLYQCSPSLEKKLTVIFIDPARRDAAGHKVARIEECAPNVCSLQDLLRATADFILIKLSPMLDVTAALMALRDIVEVHIVSVCGECKELLFLMRGNHQNRLNRQDSEQAPSPETCPVYCIDLLTADIMSSFTFTRAEEAAAPLQLAGSLSTYLYEPNSSILKAGAFKTVCQRFPVYKLASQSHLYTSQQLITDFPGRIWRIMDSATFSKQDLRRLLAGITAADLTVRGFPISVAALRRQLRLREGGQHQFIATTLGQQRLLLKVERTH